MRTRGVCGLLRARRSSEVQSGSCRRCRASEAQRSGEPPASSRMLAGRLCARARAASSEVVAPSRRGARRGLVPFAAARAAARSLSRASRRRLGTNAAGARTFRRRVVGESTSPDNRSDGGADHASGSSVSSAARRRPRGGCAHLRGRAARGTRSQEPGASGGVEPERRELGVPSRSRPAGAADRRAHGARTSSNSVWPIR